MIRLIILAFILIGCDEHSTRVQPTYTQPVQPTIICVGGWQYYQLPNSVVLRLVNGYGVRCTW